jgi:hypothetical protein
MRVARGGPGVEIKDVAPVGSGRVVCLKVMGLLLFRSHPDPKFLMPVFG